MSIKKAYLIISVALALFLSGCIWVNIPVPGSRECLYIVGDDFSMISLTRNYRKYLYPISPEGFMPGSSIGEYYYFSKNDISGLKAGNTTNVRLYENKADVRDGVNSCANMKVFGVWENVAIEGGHEKFTGSYSKVTKGEFLPPEAWQLYQSIKNMPSMEIIALLNSDEKIGAAYVKDIVFTALCNDSRLDRKDAVELKEPLVMLGKQVTGKLELPWLIFIYTIDKPTLDLINKYNVISPELERIDHRSKGNTNSPW